MGSPKLKQFKKEELFCKDTRNKRMIEEYKKIIAERLKKNPDLAKKAAQLITEMIEKK